MGRGYEISGPRQVEALASPVRQEIVDAVQASGPCSAGQLAELLGRTQDGLYYHLRVLTRVGLLCEKGTRATRRRDERVYDVPGRPLKLRYEPGRASARGRVTRVASSMLRLAQRSFARGLADGGARVRGPDRNVWAARAKAWLTHAEVVRVNELLEEVMAVSRLGRRPGASLHSITFVLAPERVVGRRRASKGGRS